jgi:DNA-binding CsgD family transcriptional regulator
MPPGSPDPETLVDRIYEAAVIPDRWVNLLGEISVVGAADAGALLVRRDDSWIGWRLSTGCPDPTEYFGSGAAARSITTPRLVGLRRPGFVADHEIFAEAEYRQDPLITDWAAPAGYFHGAATAIEIPNGDSIVVQVMRKERGPPFEPERLSKLDRLRPHLARAGLLANRWRLEQLRTAVEALNIVGLPAAVVGIGGRVAVANHLFESLTEHLVWLADGRFRFISAAASAALREHVARLNRPGSVGSGSFAVQGCEGAHPAVAHFVPVTGNARDLFGGSRALLVITPLGLRTGVHVDLLQALFDLTPSEAKVAAHLLKGRSITEIANSRAVSVETVRAQVKSVLAKSGAARQAEFIAWFGGSQLNPPPIEFPE